MSDLRPLRILHLLHRSVPGVYGYAIRSHEIVTHQLDTGMEPLVITSPSQAPLGELNSDGVEIIDGVRYFRTCGTLLPPTIEVQDRSAVRATLRILQNLVMFRKALRVAKDYRPDIVHSHSPFTCGIIGNLVGKMRTIPTIYEMRGLWEESHSARKGVGPRSLRYRAVRMLENRALKSADICCAIGSGLAKEVQSRGIGADRIEIVPNGVDVSAFVPGDASEALRDRLGLRGMTTVGYIGSFFRFEGLGLLVQMMAKLANEFNDLRLLFVGDGELMPELRESAERLGIMDRVVFTGRVPHEQIADYYRLFDVMVLPRIETRLTTLVTPLKPMEIMAMGKALVASDIGGHREMVENGENGLLFTSEDAEDLAAKCRSLVREPALRKDLGSRARRWVEANRSWAVLVDRYRAIYERLLNHGS